MFILLLLKEEESSMDALRQTRRVDRDKSDRGQQPPRGAKQIVIPMTRQQYDDIWDAPTAVRSFVEGL